MRELPDTTLDVLPRMADFAEWVVAAEASLPWPGGAFMTSYTDNRASAHELTLEASPIAGPIREIATKGFEGKAKELLAALNEIVEENVSRSREWPKTPPALSNALRRIAPNLRAIGIEVDILDRRSPRPIRIRTQQPVATVAPVGTRIPKGVKDDGATTVTTVEATVTTVWIPLQTTVMTVMTVARILVLGQTTASTRRPRSSSI